MSLKFKANNYDRKHHRIFYNILYGKGKTKISDISIKIDVISTVLKKTVNVRLW
jgi:hypothetical protein